jgi:nitrite reductase (NADH) small subunit
VGPDGRWISQAKEQCDGATKKAFQREERSPSHRAGTRRVAQSLASDPTKDRTHETQAQEAAGSRRIVKSVTKLIMSFVKVGALSALPPGSVMEAEVNGNTYAICNISGNLRAYDGICPHAGGPLGQGNIEDGRLICPWHAWEYDGLTGINDYDESLKLASFPIKAEGDDILVDVP